MKKTYINPAIEVIQIASQAQMLAGSDPEVNYDSNGAPVNAGDLDARSFDWDD